MINFPGPSQRELRKAIAKLKQQNSKSEENEIFLGLLL